MSSCLTSVLPHIDNTDPSSDASQGYEKNQVKQLHPTFMFVFQTSNVFRNDVTRRMDATSEFNKL